MYSDQYTYPKALIDHLRVYERKVWAQRRAAKAAAKLERAELAKRRAERRLGEFDVLHERAYARRNEARDLKRIARYARGKLWTSPHLVLEKALGFPVAEIRRVDVERAQRLMVKQLGWINTKRETFIEGYRHVVFVPPLVKALTKLCRLRWQA